jgi:hypothetical protein
MHRYDDLDGDSGIAAYEIGDGFVDIAFKEGGIYRYDRDAPGAMHVRRMQRLARAGRGLNTYINQRVRDNYAVKLA